MYCCVLVRNPGQNGSSERGGAHIEKLIAEYGDRAYISAYGLTGNEADAWDLVQETFVRVLKKAELYNPEMDFGRWLNRVLFRVFLNRRRSQIRRREVQPDTVSGEILSASPRAKGGGENSPEAEAQRLETNTAVFEALNALTEDQRACLVLVDIEGRSYEEAAKILGWPVGSVAGRIFRARRLMRERLGGRP